MKPRLKKFREAAKMSQRQLAERLRVSQPHYQRWETGMVPIPESQLKKLAKVLKTSPDNIAPKLTPIEPPKPANDDPDRYGDEDLAATYYGEVAVHFRGGGAPLLLSITEGAYRRLHSDMQGDARFVTVQTMANQTVAIRTDAIADLYLSHDAVDTFGPEHGTYDQAFVQLVNLPSLRDWQIVEKISYEQAGAGSDGLKKFKPADVERVRKTIMITDEQYERLITDGVIKAENLENERAKNQPEIDLILGLATTTTYQLSTGQRRTVEAGDPADLYNAMWPLTDFGNDSPDGMICLEMEEGYQIAFINPNALDYIAVPTHKFEYGLEHADEV